MQADLIREVIAEDSGRTCRPDGAACLGNSKHSGILSTEYAWKDSVTQLEIQAETKSQVVWQIVSESYLRQQWKDGDRVKDPNNMTSLLLTFSHYHLTNISNLLHTVYDSLHVWVPELPSAVYFAWDACAHSLFFP